MRGGSRGFPGVVFPFAGYFKNNAAYRPVRHLATKAHGC